ncbi:MAG: GlxA family transcriptional regulator, partial [Rhizomicrobium sp.]
MTKQPKPKRIVMLAFEDAQILDITGPLEVFGRTARFLADHRGRRDDAYVVEIIGLEQGTFRTSSGLALVADRVFSRVTGGLDTLLV